MTKAKSLWKTTIVIWTDYHPNGLSLEDLARETDSGDAYCSFSEYKYIKDIDEDEHWDGSEFFDSDGEEEDVN